MTVASQTSRADYAGNGSTTNFAVPFYFLLDTDLQVIRTDSSVSPAAVVTLTLGADYTVSGASNPAGGSVTCTVAPTAAQRLSILRSVPYTQLTHYVPNDPFPAASHERALDKLTMEVQQLAEAQGRALTLPANSTGVSTELPPPVANNIIAWNEDADALQNLDPAGLATVVAFGTAKADIFSGNGVQTDFTLSANPGALANLHGSIGAADQRPGIDFTWSGGTTVHFVTPPPAGTNNILFQYMQGLPQGATDSAASLYSAGGASAVSRTTQDRLRETISPLDKGAVGDGVTNDTTAVLAAMADGRQVDMLGLTYAVSATVPISGTVICADATLKFISNVTTAVDLRPGANVLGKLNVDVSTVTCTNGVLCDGSRQATHATAQRCDTIYVKGQNHTASTNGLMLDATVAGAANKSWLHYMKLRRIIVENFNTGLKAQASQAALTLSYVNANVVDELTLIGCKRFLAMDAASNSEISANFIQRYVFQYGAVAGSFPTDGIKLTGRCFYNRIEGFIYDWDHANTAGPIISMDSSTTDNFIVSSAYSWEVSDSGLRNRHLSVTTPAQTNVWLSPFGRSLNGAQDNTLAHWQTTVGTLTSAASSTGSASCSLSAGVLLDVQRENHSYATIGFVAGTGVASFAIEFLSTTNPLEHLSVVGAYFEPGFLPREIEVQINNGAGYVTRANFSDVQSSEVFCRLDATGGTDVYNGVLGIKFILKGSDTRSVRLRQVYANGSLQKTNVSRGGDRMVGDLRFPNGVGPVLVSPDGTEWRIVVSNAGALSATSSPTKVMTFF